MKNICFFFTLFTLLSCDNSNTEESSDNIDNAIEFSIFNSQNGDLLDSKNPNSLDISNIKLFYVVNGGKQEVYNQNLTYPRNFKVFKHENEYRIRVFLNNTETTDKPITYIQWNSSDTDTIEATFERTERSILKNKVWLNGNQVWERGNNTIASYFALTK
ncbi:hypothetical protein [Flavobacterium sp. 140616W15]|uniref:hypothetical protein n=1 Tax=Flavobacterium sp. 140616W15 TaxID=2478552 RepID=UPI000F0C6116|nr:hypothetical protein [Flavobacterium sp. 140616W15]AYN06162.1 hypothetical protein EAG11_19870 [Flavobacterium sp. 140616W15]